MKRCDKHSRVPFQIRFDKEQCVEEDKAAAMHVCYSKNDLKLVNQIKHKSTKINGDRSTCWSSLYLKHCARVRRAGCRLPIVPTIPVSDSEAGQAGQAGKINTQVLPAPIIALSKISAVNWRMGAANLPVVIIMHHHAQMLKSKC